jgi:hypothetical protein
MPGSRRSLTFRNKSDLVHPKPVELHLDVVAPGCGDLVNLVGMPRRHCEFERTGAAAYLGDLVSESSGSGRVHAGLDPPAAEFQRRQHDSVAYQSQRPVTVPAGGLESQGRGRGSKGPLGLLCRPYGHSVNHLQRIWNASDGLRLLPRKPRHGFGKSCEKFRFGYQTSRVPVIFAGNVEKGTNSLFHFPHRCPFG